jgi:molybdate transport system regulatory protein
MRIDDANGVNSRQTVPPCINALIARRKVWFEWNGEFVIGEGGFDLLDAIASTGSLTRAARVVGWSYRHAWGYLRRAEARLGEQLTVTRSGKGTRRGVEITAAARRVMGVAKRAGWRTPATRQSHALQRVKSMCRR